MAILLFMIMVLCLVPNTVYAVSGNGAGASPDTVTRVQWLQKLEETFEFSVEEDNYPDNYYADLSSGSEDYHVIMLATEFGVLDIPAGENVRPNDLATREFAAHTLNYCLGFQLEEGSGYTFSDKEAAVYLDDDQIAVNRGWFALADGKFAPEQGITASEMDKMLADAVAVRASAVVDDSHDNTYQFADFVKEVPKTADVSVDENDVVTISGASGTIAQGDTFVVWPSELPSIYVAKTVTEKGGILTITTGEADTSKAVLLVDSSGTVDMDLSQFEEAEGATVSYVRTKSQARSMAKSRGIDVKQNSVVITKDILLGNGAKAAITCDLSDLSVSHTIDTKKQSFYASVKGNSAITCNVSLDAVSAALGSSSVPLGSVRIAGVGKVAISADLALNGKITATYTGSFETGMQYSKQDGFRLVKNFQKRSFTTTAEAKATIGLKISFGLDFVVLSGDIYAKIGVSATFTSSDYNDGKKPDNCTQISAWLYVSVGAEAKVNLVLWSKSWNKTLDVYNQGNSPVRLSFHYEDGKQVASCARKGTGSKASTKYVSPGDSIYGSSSYGDVSSTITDSDGNTVTVWSYTVNDDYATITGYNGSGTVIAVPSTLDGYAVNAIGSRAFEKNTKITRVVVPEGVTSIGSYAFSGCKAL